ncbi:hypothetical protein CAEBREN_04308 [Caenorhabditis brenneri]|uniref:DUF281 domain-containing protein n=1 Tax=Caenorhabditis brenneri TaxID=135651 RepID=G0MCU4_CAEBE|nr:hypothetical protein CAEBREN_04308 [Caenorhabditis brenneri]
MKFGILYLILNFLILARNAYASTTTGPDEVTTPLVAKDCNSCSPSSLKLVARNNTPAPGIMGNFQEDGCLVTVVACDIPECSNALLDSYRPDGTFKRVTNEAGDVWPHLEMKCSPDGEWIWDGEVQTEFSCYAEDCVIPSTTSASTQNSWSTTVNINGTETTISPFSTDSTTSFLTTTPEKCSLCMDVATVMADENVKFETPVITPRPADPGSSDCSFFQITCKAEDGKRCERMELYDGFTVIAEDNFIINYNVSCPGDKFIGAEGANVLSKLMCKYKNCEDYTSTTGITMGSSTSGTGTCSGKCANIESVMADENVRFEKPLFIPKEIEYDACAEISIVCQAEEGQRCEQITLYDRFGSVATDNFKVQIDIWCTSKNLFMWPAYGGVMLFEKPLMCKYKNCVGYTPPSTTTVEPTTTITPSCSTCDIQTLFNYEFPEEYFQPWYQDIATTDCACKAHEVSCELYNVDTCEFHALMVTNANLDPVILASSETNVVKGNIYCNGNGKYQADGQDITSIYCISDGCVKS